jgi:hypothetical protein
LALKYLKIKDYYLNYSDKYTSLVFGWKSVKNLRMKSCPKSFPPKLSFVKSIPEGDRGNVGLQLLQVEGEEVGGEHRLLGVPLKLGLEPELRGRVH